LEGMTWLRPLIKFRFRIWTAWVHA
jgi:hypothetical protein